MQIYRDFHTLGLPTWSKNHYFFQLRQSRCFFSSKFLDVYASKINGEDLDKERATEISKTVNDFEKK